MAEGIGGDPLGAAELAGAVAQPADLANEPASRIQDLHAAVHGVGDQEAALGVRRQVRGEIEFAGAVAAAAEFSDELPLPVEDDDAMAQGIGDTEAAKADSQSGGALEAVGDLALELA